MRSGRRAGTAQDYRFVTHICSVRLGMWPRYNVRLKDEDWLRPTWKPTKVDNEVVTKRRPRKR